MIRTLLLILISVSLSGCFSDELPSNTSAAGEFNLMEVMKDAKPPKTDYSASIQFLSFYQAEKYEVYLLNNETEVFTKIDSGELQRNSKIDFIFEEYLDQTDLTLIFRLTEAGLPFLPAQPGEFICYYDIKKTFFSASVKCDETTTSMALAAKIEAVSSFDQLLDVERITQWKKLDSLSQKITLDMYNLVMSSFQTMLIEMPHTLEYDMRNVSIIDKLSIINVAMMNFISENHYLDIKFLENLITFHFPGVEEVGFILSTSGAKWVDRHNKSYLTSEKRRALIGQFFLASNDLVFIDSQAFRVQEPSYDPVSRTVNWINWPWFEKVEIFVDDLSKGLTQASEFSISNDNFTNVIFKPLGILGKFHTIQVSKSALIKRGEH